MGEDFNIQGPKHTGPLSRQSSQEEGGYLGSFEGHSVKASSQGQGSREGIPANDKSFFEGLGDYIKGIFTSFKNAISNWLGLDKRVIKQEDAALINSNLELAKELIKGQYPQENEPFYAALLDVLRPIISDGNVYDKESIQGPLNKEAEALKELRYQNIRLAESAMNTFYDLAAKAKDESKTGEGRYTGSESIEACKKRSEDFIRHAIHSTPLFYKQGLTEHDFYPLIAAQHYIDFDCHQLDKASDKRKGEIKNDQFRDSGVAEQLYKDFGRAEHAIENKKFDNENQSKEKKDEASQAFVDFIGRVCRGVGVEDPETIKKITEKVSAQTNQSGFANIAKGYRFLEEKDSFEKFTPSGAKLDVRYELTNPSPGVIQLDLLSMKSKFAGNTVYRNYLDGRPQLEIQCDPKESLLKESASVRFVIQKDGKLDVCVDRVEDVVNLPPPKGK